jgi:dolichol-phosphate mannosyltransferase
MMDSNVNASDRPFTARADGCTVPACDRRLRLSVVIPVFNEAENVEPLAAEIAEALGPTQVEIIFVDDGSTDATVARVQALRRDSPRVRLLRHAARRGQSAALHTGMMAARAEWVVTLDGDGQNDPRDIPRLLAALTSGAEPPRLVMGYRQARKDRLIRRVASRVANSVRRGLLRDETPDTGCGLKIIHRETFLRIPYFDHMHRFLPALFRREGVNVVSIPVHHRPRVSGQSKYGVFDRLWVGITDLFGVWWLIRRAPPSVAVREA